MIGAIIGDIAGSVAEACYWHIPEYLIEDAKSKLDKAQKKIPFDFENTFSAR